MDQEFKKQFGLPCYGFLEPIDFTDGIFGFGAFKKYSDGYASLFKISIGKEWLEKEDPLKPLFITMSYGKETEDGLLLSSSTTKIKKNITGPIDLTSNDEFFYNIETHEFFHKKKKINASDVLKYVDEWHIKPTKLIKGFWLRIKLIFWRVIATSAIKYTSNFLVYCLYFISGTKISNNIWQRTIFKDSAKQEDIPSSKETAGKTIDMFGYKASVWSVIFYCLLHLLIYITFFFYNFRPKLVIEIITNNFLTIAYVIFSLWFIENLLPRILKFLILKTSSLFHNLSFKTIKI